MFIQDLGEMRKVIFLRVSCEVFKNMVDAGWRSPMIEGFQVMRQNNDHSAAGSSHSLPLLQRLDGVREVLQIMRRQDEVIGLCGDRRQVGSVAENAFPGRLAGAKNVTVLV